MAVIQARPTHILYQCAKFGDDRTAFNVILTCATFNIYKRHIFRYLWRKSVSHAKE